jgi:hypothetical protein
MRWHDDMGWLREADFEARGFLFFEGHEAASREAGYRGLVRIAGAFLPFTGERDASRREGA